MPGIKKEWVSWEEFEKIQGGAWRPAPHTHPRSEIPDFWSATFWGNIPDKPSTYPPSAHTLASHSTKAHSELTDVTENQHHNKLHFMTGVAHSAAGLTIGHVIRASGAETFVWAQLQHGDLGGVTSDLHHAQSHTLASHSTKNHSELTGVTQGQHHAQFHAAAHLVGAGDALSVGVPVNIGTANSAGTATNFARRDHVHAHPSGLGIDLHHTKSHNLLNTSHHLDVLTGSPVRGDIIIANATPKWSRLAKGANMKYLRSGATDVYWDDVVALVASGFTLNALIADNKVPDSCKVDGEHASAIVTKARVDAIGADHAQLSNVLSGQHHAQLHATTHAPGQGDPFTVGVPSSIGNANSEGVLTTFVRRDHVHNHPAGLGVNLHHNQLHAATHHSGGGDAVKLDNLASPDDNTDLNASTLKHGLLLKLGGGTSNFLRADGTWAAPPGGSLSFLDLTDTPANYTGQVGKFVRVNAIPDGLDFYDIAAGDLPSHNHAWADVSKTGSNLTDLVTRQHAALTNVTSDQHHPQSHTLVSHTARDHHNLTGLGDDDHAQYLLASGARGLSGNWDAGTHQIRALQFYADYGAGNPPFIVSSTTKVANLNADLLEGYHGAEASTASTVVVRNSAQDINARLFRSEYGTINPTINYIMTQIDLASNNYIRPSTPAQLISALNLALTTRKLDDFGTPDDNTDLNALTTRHGLLKKLGGGTTNFLRADGAWATPTLGAHAASHEIGGGDLLAFADITGFGTYIDQAVKQASTPTFSRLTLSSNPSAGNQAVAREYIESRLQNLVTNGSGLMIDNYNFSLFTFDQVETHGGAGSFKHIGAYANKNADEYIPVDCEKFYRFALWAMSGDTGGGNFNPANKQYAGLIPYDIDKLIVYPYYYSKVSGSTDTTLAADLDPGDPTITLTDATGWYEGVTGHMRNIIWYGYENSYGYIYPDYTYSRTDSGNLSDFRANGAWAQDGIVGNVITLRENWPGPAIPAGTAVRNNQSGGTYKYITLSNFTVPNAWTRYEGNIGGWDVNGSMATSLFPYGSAFVRLMFLCNYTGGTDPTNIIRWSDLWFSEMSIKNLEDHASAHHVGGGDLVSHDDLTDWAANKHVVLPNTIANVLSNHTLAVHNALDITELGTVSSGVWQGSAIANTYIAGINQNLLTSSSPTFASLTLTGDLFIADAKHAYFGSTGEIRQTGTNLFIRNFHAGEDRNIYLIASDSGIERIVLQYEGAENYTRIYGPRDQNGIQLALITRKLDDFGTPDDNTDLNALTTRHGLCPKLGGGTANFLRADGAWAVPPGAGGAGTHRARGYQSTAQAIPNNTATKVTLNSETYDPGSHFSTVNYRYVASLAGYYHVIGTIRFSQIPAITHLTLAIYRNGSSMAYVMHYDLQGGIGSGFQSLTVSDIIYLAVDQYVELYVTQTSGSTKYLSQYSQATYMAVSLVP